MLTIIIEWIGVLLAYWIPGAALASLVEWRGVGRLTRWIAPFALSIAVAPVLLVLPTLFTAYKPNLWILAIFSAVLFLVGGLLTRFGKRPVLLIRSRSANPPSRRETILGAAFALLVTGLAILPRIHMIINGGEIGTAVLTDTYWHVSDMMAVARSGIPPRHFLFPDLPLLYYYWSWIYPAVLAGLPTIGQSLLRLFNLHVAINLLIFLGVLSAFVRLNLNSLKTRWFAMIFLTLAGGFDFFTKPNLWSHEWWQNLTPVLVSKVQIPALSVNFMNDPHHLAGATAFLFLLMLWRNIRGSLVVRGMLATAAAAFIFGTSTYVFVSTLTAAIAWAVLYRRALLRRRAILVMAGLTALFLLLSWSQVLLTLDQSSALRWGNFRVVIVEAATGTTYVRGVVLDQILTLLAFPLVASVLLTIEMGLPFVIYAVWLFRSLGRPIPFWRRFLVVYPAMYIPIAFLIQNVSFSTRGILTTQITVVLAAAFALEEIGRQPWTRVQRAVLRYGFVIILIAQMLSASVEWWSYARKGLAEVLRFEKGFLALPIPTDNAFPDGDTHLIPPMPGLPEELQFVYWVNANLPENALLVEINMPEDSNRMHLLERMRFIDPAELDTVAHWDRELNIINTQKLADWWQAMGSGTVWEKALRSEYVLQNHVPIYVIVHMGTLPQLGEPVYQDDWVTIYLLSQGQ